MNSISMAKQKNNFKKILSSKIFLFLMSLVLIVLAVNVGQESYRKHKLVKEIDQLKNEVERLEGGNHELANLMEYLKQETYLEKEARIKLNLKKPGEKVVIVPQNQESENSALNQEVSLDQTNQTDFKNESANYWKWWEYFFQSSLD